MNYLANNIIKPKFIEKHNISTRFSTNESNESFESNKLEERYFTPNQKLNNGFLPYNMMMSQMVHPCMK
jgi:hypothetical protein